MDSNEVRDFVKKTIEKVALGDDSDTLRLRDILAQNILFYGTLLQRERGVISFDSLLDLVGVQDPEVLQVALQKVDEYMSYVGETSRQNPPFVFSDALIESVREQFYGENSLYQLDQKLPFSDVTGEDIVFWVNNLRTENPNPGRIIANIFQQIFDVQVIDTRYEEFYILKGTNPDADKRAFILAVMDDHSTLTQGRYYSFLIHFISVIYDIEGSPYTLMVCPSVTGNIRDDVNASRGIYAMWELSLVRLLSLLAQLSDEEKAMIKADMSLLFAEPIQNSYAYAEGHVLANIKRHIVNQKA